MDEPVLFVESGIRRRGVRADCAVCGGAFVRHANGTRRYCSTKCASVARRHRVGVQCRQCGTAFEKAPSKVGLSRSGFEFCSRTCKDLAQRLTSDCVEIRPDHYGTGTRAYRHLVDLDAGCCGCGEKRRFLLFVHHADGDRANNRKENLEVVCGNCHIIRHLQQIDGEWTYNSCALTPRPLIAELTRGTAPIESPSDGAIV